MTQHWTQTDSRTVYPIVEFRRYTTRPGTRDRLIALFEERLVAPQEAAGARILGSFTVAGSPESFVWLRGFADMRTRQAALQAFYEGPVWMAYRDAANACIADSDDVHLLRAIAPNGGLGPDAMPTAGRRSYLAMLSELRFPEGIGNYHNWLRLFLRKEGMDPLASFATLLATNSYPRLPVHQNRSVHLALMPFIGRLPELPRELRAALRQQPELLVLEPTAGSALH
ncbi:MAG TPA: NIPSNAP family protein [Devosiaceae bacterium]|nr:NIPSNAP family protein [Devosiaceae bacterium]